jgi:hypothetical protein
LAIFHFSAAISSVPVPFIGTSRGKSMRNVKPLRRRIHGRIIPATVAADGNFLDEMTGFSGVAKDRRQAKQNGQENSFHGRGLAIMTLEQSKKNCSRLVGQKHETVTVFLKPL